MKTLINKIVNSKPAIWFANVDVYKVALFGVILGQILRYIFSK